MIDGPWLLYKAGTFLMSSPNPPLPAFINILDMGLSSLNHESEKDQPRKSLTTYGRQMGSNELCVCKPSGHDCLQVI